MQRFGGEGARSLDSEAPESAAGPVDAAPRSAGGPRSAAPRDPWGPEGSAPGYIREGPGSSAPQGRLNHAVNRNIGNYVEHGFVLGSTDSNAGARHKTRHVHSVGQGSFLD